MVRQWGVRVPVKRGEEIRRALIEEGVLDLSLKVQRVGSALVLPLTGPREGAEIFNFETQPERQILPRHELIGGIAVMLDRDPAGSSKILTTRPSIHTVVFAASEVSGEYRTRKFEIDAGTPTIRTEVIEYRPIIGLLLSSWATIVDHWSRSYIECLFGFLWALLFSSLITGRATFMVQIETEAGKSNILESKDKDFIQRIVDAMN